VKILVITKEGNREQGTGNREQGTGNREQEKLMFKNMRLK
jgi:hypothetical protein